MMQFGKKKCIFITVETYQLCNISVFQNSFIVTSALFQNQSQCFENKVLIEANDKPVHASLMSNIWEAIISISYHISFNRFNNFVTIALSPQNFSIFFTITPF